MQASAGSWQEIVATGLWPLVERFATTHPVAGIAVGVVRDGEVVARGFGVRDVGTGEPVTPATMFHLASVSKPFVASAVVALADGPDPRLDLDAPITDRIPELTLADGRQHEVTARGLLSHTSGLPDVTDYGWHDPQLGDEALEELARSIAGWRLRSEPGATHSYSNAGYDLLGLALARAAGTTFEEAVRRLVLAPLGMGRSTFLRADVPEDLAASPHVGRPLTVPDGSYPYTRRHAPSSTLHANVEELCRWMRALLAPDDPALLARRDLMWQPVVAVGNPPWEEYAGLGWAVGSHRGHRTVGHSGTDPGFIARVVLVPDRATGVVVLVNSNTVPASAICAAALDLLLGDVSPGEPSEAAAALLAETEVDEGYADAVWGAIELHRTELVWPVLREWVDVRPDSAPAWTMTGWAHQVDGRVDLARATLTRALELDPDDVEAAQLLAATSGSAH